MAVKLSGEIIDQALGHFSDFARLAAKKPVNPFPYIVGGGAAALTYASDRAAGNTREEAVMDSLITGGVAFAGANSIQQYLEGRASPRIRTPNPPRPPAEVPVGFSGGVNIPEVIEETAPRVIREPGKDPVVRGRRRGGAKPEDRGVYVGEGRNRRRVGERLSDGSFVPDTSGGLESAGIKERAPREETARPFSQPDPKAASPDSMRYNINTGSSNAQGPKFNGELLANLQREEARVANWTENPAIGKKSNQQNKRRAVERLKKARSEYESFLSSDPPAAVVNQLPAEGETDQVSQSLSYGVSKSHFQLVRDGRDQAGTRAAQRSRRSATEASKDRDKTGRSLPKSAYRADAKRALEVRGESRLASARAKLAARRERSDQIESLRVTDL